MLLKQGDTLSDACLSDIAIPDYNQYFEAQEKKREEARQVYLQEHGRTPEAYPRVIAYEDKILRIEGVGADGADIMYVPQEAYLRCN